MAPKIKTSIIKFKKISALFFLGLYLFIGINILMPRQTLADDGVKFTPQISIPGSSFQKGVGTEIGTTSDIKNPVTGKIETIMQSNLLAKYIKAFYNWGLYIVGALAVLMLMVAGVTWITSAGDSGKIANATKMIEGSLLGTVLLVGAWFFLNTINPNLTKLPAINTVVIAHLDLGCCQGKDGFGKITTNEDCEVSEGSFFKDQTLSYEKKCEPTVCCISKQVGSSAFVCSYAGRYRCEVLFKQEGIEDSCNNISRCTQAGSLIVDCNNVADANKPENVDGYCYGGRLYMGKGELGEPCGNKPYSKCDVSEKNGKTCDWDTFGGRDCKDSCCEFNEDGTRVE